MRFAGRLAAASLLVEDLLRFRGCHPMVLGVPRGGVPMAKVVADRLGCDFDVVIVRKLRTTKRDDLAMGAVDEAGRVYHYGARPPVSDLAHAEEVAAQVAEIRRLREVYSRARHAVAPAGYTALIVDDGIATGASIVAAIRSVRAARPLRIVVAVPVAARSGLDLAKAYADEVVCLHSPRLFFAIGDFYDDFAAVADSEVVELLGQREFKGAG